MPSTIRPGACSPGRRQVGQSPCATTPSEQRGRLTLRWRCEPQHPPTRYEFLMIPPTATHGPSANPSSDTMHSPESSRDSESSGPSVKPRRSDGSDETIPAAPRVRWLDKKDGRRLIVFTSLGIGLTAGLVFAVMTIFVRLIGGEGSWWRIWTHELGDGQWFEASRVTVALVALTVAGGAAYLAYRRQHTADQNQKTAAETQRITAQAYALSIRQHDATLRRERRDRFTNAATQLAHTSAAVRIAGVYAMAALADDWHAANDPAEVQTCVDVLCGYLRLPYDPEATENHQTRTTVTTHQFIPGGRTVSGQVEKHFEYRQNDREVRATILRVIKNHLELSAAVSWGDRVFDFHSAVLEDFDINRAIFRGPVSFDGATFTGKTTRFDEAKFTGEQTTFDGAKFTGASTSFCKAEFTGKTTLFDGADFTGERTSFDGAKFTSGWTTFDGAIFTSESTLFDGAIFTSESTTFDWATFNSSHTSFHTAIFTGKRTTFDGVEFTSERTTFDGAKFNSAHTSFHWAKLTGAQTTFHWAEFTGEHTSFDEAEFTGEQTSFHWAKFIGNQTSFDGSRFTGEVTSFDRPVEWRNVYFDWDPKPGHAATAVKPGTVKPTEWPPIVATEDPKITHE